MSGFMDRAKCLQALAKYVTDEPVVVAVGGLIDEWSQILPRKLNLYSGGMGLASSIGLGLSIALPERRVIVLDGDGAVLMNLGTLVTTSEQSPPNLLHLIFHNGTYQSSGGFPVPGEGKASLVELANAAGGIDVRSTGDLESWKEMIPDLLASRQHSIVVLEVTDGDAAPLFSGDKLMQRQRFEQALSQN